MGIPLPPSSEKSVTRTSIQEPSSESQRPFIIIVLRIVRLSTTQEILEPLTICTRQRMQSLRIGAVRSPVAGEVQTRSNREVRREYRPRRIYACVLYGTLCRRHRQQCVGKLLARCTHRSSTVVVGTSPTMIDHLLGRPVAPVRYQFPGNLHATCRRG